MRSSRPKSFRQAEAERELFVVAGRAHRHRDGAAADADFEWFFDCDVVALASPARQPDDVDRRCGVRRSLHGDELTRRDRRGLLGSEA